MDKGTALGSGAACGRHHALSSGESPSSTSVFSTRQEKAKPSNRPQEGKVQKTRAEALQTPFFAVGGGSQGVTQVAHRPVRKSQGSVSFIPLGADHVGGVLKQSSRLRLWAEMVLERLGCCS